MTDQQCQSCHSENYHSFETDHPEFTSWPVSRRSRIAFDHTSHAMKHFVDQNTAFDCALCHVDDKAQNIKLLAPYEETCAHCHDKELRQNSEVGLALFALPMLDLEALKDVNLDVGEWPEFATGDFDGPLPPAMRLLLMTNDKAKTALNFFGNDFDFSDVDPDDKQQVRFAHDLVWSIKYLLYDLSIEGQKAIQKRLTRVLGRDVSMQEVNQLAGSLAEPLFQDAASKWLPELNVEVAKRRWGRTAMKIGWVPGEILMRYQAEPDELLAPNPLNGLVKPLASTVSTPPATKAPIQEPLRTTQDAQPSTNQAVNLPVNQPVSPVVRQAPQRQVPAQPPIAADAKPPTMEQLATNEADVLIKNPLQGLIRPLGQKNQQPRTPRTGVQPNSSSQATDGVNSGSQKIVNRPQQPPRVIANLPKDIPMPTPEQLASNDPSELAMNPLKKLFASGMSAPTNPLSQTPIVQAPSIQQPGNGQATPPTPESPSSRLPYTESPQTTNVDQPVVNKGGVPPRPTSETPSLPPTSTPPTVSQSPVVTQTPRVTAEPLRVLSGSVPVVANGAWLRDDQVFQVTYRPGGHADSILKGWTDLLASVADANIRPETSALFKELTSMSGVGTCKSCHTIDQLENDKFQVNWRPEYRDVSVRQFTRFSHAPHVMQPILEDCSHCHSLDGDSGNKDSFVGFDPQVAISNFRPIMKENCSSCHRAGHTDNGCTQCHNYHVGSHVLGTNQ